MINTSIISYGYDSMVPKAHMARLMQYMWPLFVHHEIGEVYLLSQFYSLPCLMGIIAFVRHINVKPQGENFMTKSRCISPRAPPSEL
jgi:hypothetical protein